MTNKSRSHPNAIAIHVAERKLAWDSKREKCLDDMLIRTIQGLDVFIAQSSDLRIGIIARILQTAKEELVHWAANQDFNETRAESFINRLLYTNSAYTSLACAKLNGASGKRRT